MKIGLYFGSFNPVHCGHLITAKYVLNALKLDKIMFIVSPNNPFKDKKELCDVSVRIMLLDSAINNEPCFEINDIETRLPVPSYTINTINELLMNNSNDEYYLIMGIDNWIEFDKWKDYDKILSNINIVVVPRVTSHIGYDINDMQTAFSVTKLRFSGYINNSQYKVVFLREMPLIQLSSTFIRDCIRKNIDVKFFVPESVYNVIHKLNLYV